MISIQSLLSEPVPNDPQDASVASMYLKDKKLFDQTAKYWTLVFSSPKDDDTVADYKTRAKDENAKDEETKEDKARDEKADEKGAKEKFEPKETEVKKEKEDGSSSDEKSKETMEQVQKRKLIEKRKEFKEFECKLSELRSSIPGNIPYTEHQLIHSLSCNGWDISRARNSLTAMFGKARSV